MRSQAAHTARAANRRFEKKQYAQQGFEGKKDTSWFLKRHLLPPFSFKGLPHGSFEETLFRFFSFLFVSFPRDTKRGSAQATN